MKTQEGEREAKKKKEKKARKYVRKQEEKKRWNDKISNQQINQNDVKYKEMSICFCFNC